MRGDEACQNGWHDGGDVWINMETPVVEHGGRELHHLGQDEETLEIMRDFFGYELHEIRYQLVETWVVAKTGQGCHAVLVVGLIEEGAADFFEVQLEFFGEDVLDKGLNRNGIIATNGCKRRVGPLSLGQEFLIS